jgi:AGZA family xanthine/uracil permease-like MFS transporter
MAWRVKGAILIGILATGALGWAFGLVQFHPTPYSVADLSATVFRLDIPGALGLGGGTALAAVLEIIFVFLFVDLFDNVGTLVAVTTKAGLVKPDGSIPRLNRILLTDSAATMVGALAGTSTTTSYIESAAGVQAGGRTGLTAVVTGLCFLAILFVAPYAGVIPGAATAPALILVGAMMMTPLAAVDWEDPGAAIPAFLTLVTIPLTFSIANGLAIGLTSYAALRLIRGQARPGDWLLYLLAVLFIIRFAWLAAA